MTTVVAFSVGISEVNGGCVFYGLAWLLLTRLLVPSPIFPLPEMLYMFKLAGGFVNPFSPFSPLAKLGAAHDYPPFWFDRSLLEPF